MSAVQLGSEVRAAREERGLSIRRAASACGLGVSHYVRLEGGQVARPEPETLRKVADGLGARYEGLMVAAGYL